MNTPTKLVIAAVLFCTLLGFLMFGLTTGLMLYFQSRQASLPHLSVKDPDSATVVTVDGINPLFGPICWGCTISVDGQRPTQSTGWPKSGVSAGAAPKSLIWHKDP